MKTTSILPDFTKKMEDDIKLQDSEIRHLSRRIKEMDIMMKLRE